MRWILGLLAILAMAVFIAVQVELVRVRLPEPIAPNGVVHDLPSGERVRVLRFQRHLMRSGLDWVDGYDVEIVPVEPASEGQALADAVFDDLLATEADMRALNDASVSVRGQASVFRYFRGAQLEWRRAGPIATTAALLFNLEAPPSLKLNSGETLLIEGERARLHVRADGEILFEAWLNWPAENWDSIPLDARRQKGYELLRQYWLMRGKSRADETKAKKALFRLYTTPFEGRFKSRQNLWTGVVRKGGRWQDMPALVGDAAAMQDELRPPPSVDPGNRLKLPSGESIVVEEIVRMTIKAGGYRKGLVLAYRSEAILEDREKLEADAQRIFDVYLRRECHRQNVQYCLVQARYEALNVLGLAWDDTYDAVFELKDGAFRRAAR